MKEIEFEVTKWFMFNKKQKLCKDLLKWLELSKSKEEKLLNLMWFLDSAEDVFNTAWSDFIWVLIENFEENDT